MIRITLPIHAPNILLTNGLAENTANIILYTTNSALYNSGKTKFLFKNTLYGAMEVKNALRTAHNDKCCYCETIFSASSYGAVEHYRPKGAVKEGKKKKFPGYYWLAYDFTNLLYICERCNTNKGSKFPLMDPSKRANNHNDSIAGELPYFLHPGFEDPAIHLKFINDAPVALSPRGSKMIEIMELDRLELVENRNKTLQILEALMDLARVTHHQNRDMGLYNKTLDSIRKYLSLKSEYTAMNNSYFSKYAAESAFANI